MSYSQSEANLLKQLADAQATVEALQARVKELEARQYFGACAKCLTNAWRICNGDTPDAVEMKCSNGSTWWLCDYCAMKIRLAETYRIAQDSENERLELTAQLTQRTAELEALQREARLQKEGGLRERKVADSYHQDLVKCEAALDAEREKVKGLEHSRNSFEQRCEELSEIDCGLRDERDRLRKALEQIAKWDKRSQSETVQQFAQAALTPAAGGQDVPSLRK